MYKSMYTQNVPHTVHVLFILSKISKDILRTSLRTFEADILHFLQLRVLLEIKPLANIFEYLNNKTRLTLQIESAVIVESSYYRCENGLFRSQS